MYLINFPKIRIQKYPKGYVAEIQKCTWYGKIYWVHIVPTSGIRDAPWYYKTAQKCMEDTAKTFALQLEYNYKFKWKWRL
jgi:uncharacterized protein (DUF427 family)